LLILFFAPQAGLEFSVKRLRNNMQVSGCLKNKENAERQAPQVRGWGFAPPTHDLTSKPVHRDETAMNGTDLKS
jgi:hypothetical protein